tara:strand:+ start:1641 stop:2852 length:1212 start_codon:yes stop_codon:yes gene_type:complete
MELALIIVIVCIIAIYFFATYKPKKQENLKDLYTEGLDLMVDGYRQGAYENFKKIIATETDNVKAYLKLGQVIREGGNPENALKVHMSLNFRKNLTYYERVELYKNLALDYYKLNDLDHSIEQCKRILKINPKNDWALSKLVFFYQSSGDWLNSKKYLDLRLQYSGRKDSHKLSLYKIQEGRAFLMDNKFRAARDCFENALNIDNDCVIAHYFIGDSYSQESDRAYNNAQKNKSDSNQNEYDSLIKDAKDLLAKAIDNWVDYAKLKPESSWMVIHLLRDALFALDRYNEIEVILKDILANDSDNVDIIAALADYYDHMGDSKSALKIIDNGLVKDDSSLLVRLIKLKLLFSDSASDSNNKKIKLELDNLIKDIVKDSDYQVYKNTSTDSDALWLYSFDSKDKN